MMKAALLLASLIVLSTSAYAAQKVEDSAIEVKLAKDAAGEDYERDVDEVARSAQENAISRLIVLLKKYRNTSQEPILLSKLADLQQQNAAIVFRISHAKAHRSKKELDLSTYNKSMTQSIGTLNTLIGKYPNYAEISHAFYLRGKAYEEVKDTKRAEEDYVHLVSHFPESEDDNSAYMSLAEFAIDANNHEKAIGFLKEVEKHPEDSHYPFALYKLAWSYYNLKKIPEALSYAERHIQYYTSNTPKQDLANLATSDNALRENTLLDTTVFYFEGYEENLPQYSLTQALPYFKKLEDGPVLGHMLARFAKLLRSHEHEADLVSWKDHVLLSESERPESIDIVITVYEYQLNKRYYTKLVETTQDFVKLYQKHPKYESVPKAQKMVLDTAEQMQTMIIKNKAADDAHAFSVTLASLYDAFTKMVDESDPRIPRVHYNLAETLFEIKDYPAATVHYRWVVDHGKWPEEDSLEASPKNNKDSKGAGNVIDASLKAISSRYEVLREKQMIPGALTPKPLQQNSDKALDPLLGEWVSWIETHLKHSDKGTENFVFEADRSIYAQDHLVEATTRMRRFAVKHPNSKYAVPSASLVVDTYIATQDWEATHELAKDFMEVKEWKDTDFGKRLFAVAADAFYKQVEAKHKAHDYEKALAQADQFLKLYSKSTHLAECLNVAGDSSMITAQKERGLKYYSRLITEVPSSEYVANALLARAGIEEDRYDFDQAAVDYKSYLALPPAQMKSDLKTQEDLRRKVLALTWLAGDLSEVKAILDSKLICSDALATECEKYQALSVLTSDRSYDENTMKAAFEKARTANSDTKTLWAAIALEGAKNLGFRDRLLMVKIAASGWEDLDPMIKFNLIPYLSNSIPHVFQLDRMAMNEVAPLKAEEKWIRHRVDMVHEMENAATQAVKLPWSRIRASIINETAGLYLDMSRELAALPPPKNISQADLPVYEETIQKLTLPFEEKGQDMRAKAFELASRFSIEEESFKSIAEPFFTENPSQAKLLKPLDKIEKPRELDLAFLDEIDGSGKWDRIKKGKSVDEQNPALRLKVLWAKALANQHWSQVAFFMQEAQEKALIQAGVMSAVKAISLSAVGARGEALSELEEGRKDLAPDQKKFITFSLIRYSLQSSSRDHTQSLLKSVEPTDLNGDEAKLVAKASTWSTLKK